MFKADCKTTDADGVRLKEYQLWYDMMRRCYGKNRESWCPTYLGCEVSENFKSFKYFKEWCNKQKGFGNKGWQLDKDMLGTGGKLYSEDTCVFVPRVINLSLLLNKGIRGATPIGVHYLTKANKYQVNISRYGKVQHLGRFDSEHQAFAAYQQGKEEYTKELAERYKEDLDTRVYTFLQDYKVEITD